MSQEPNSPYALVAYVGGDLGNFAQQLRARLDPQQAHLAPHVTVLPPRALLGSGQQAAAQLRETARRFSAFDVELDGVDSFAPASPTAFIGLKSGTERFREMHIAFNSGALQCAEPWPYVPHLTIAKLDDFARLTQALPAARQSWSEYRSVKTVKIGELTFVREAEPGRWLDLQVIPLQGHINAP